MTTVEKYGSNSSKSLAAVNGRMEPLSRLQFSCSNVAVKIVFLLIGDSGAEQPSPPNPPASFVLQVAEQAKNMTFGSWRRITTTRKIQFYVIPCCLPGSVDSL